MNTKKHNGWTNYATWRVNLEIIDGISFVKEDITSSEGPLSIADIADFLRDDVAENAISDGGTIPEGLALDYAHAFLADVNWHEIAEHVAENYPDLLK